jgi:hypothetical protein
MSLAALPTLDWHELHDDLGIQFAPGPRVHTQIIVTQLVLLSESQNFSQRLIGQNDRLNGITDREDGRVRGSNIAHQ